MNNSSHLERSVEIDRINGWTVAVWNGMKKFPQGVRGFSKILCDQIFDQRNIKTKLEGAEHIPKNKPCIFSLNHPGVLEEHKILFNNTHSVPYYILFFDSLIEKQTGKKVHMIVTDPIDPAYREIIKHLEYIMLPPEDKNGVCKMTPEQRKEFNKTVKDYLDNGEFVGIFPEGHAFGKDNIGPLGKGLFHLADQNPNASVIPVRMKGFDETYCNIEVTIAPESRLEKNGQATIDEAMQIFRKKVFVDTLGLNPVETR